ncbi:MAG: hypothetical protein KC800_20370 [Candidatus Eremiobacteraeota bacterium]|nr:hypothetical protein [Candidatus Eremiobacteraeota bacterium]
MFRDTIIELDRASKSLFLHDIETAALCLRKALVGHTEMAPPPPSPDPRRTDPFAELFKAVTALEIKEYDLAALCLEKALEQGRDVIPAETYEAAGHFAMAVRRKNFSSMGTFLREAVKSLVGDRVVEPVALN